MGERNRRGGKSQGRKKKLPRPFIFVFVFVFFFVIFFFSFLSSLFFLFTLFLFFFFSFYYLLAFVMFLAWVLGKRGESKALLVNSLFKLVFLCLFLTSEFCSVGLFVWFFVRRYSVLLLFLLHFPSPFQPNIRGHPR